MAAPRLGPGNGSSSGKGSLEEPLSIAEPEQLEEFFEAAAVALHWVGPDGTILRANRFELDLLGYARAEYEGRNVADFHVDADTIRDILERLSSGETLRDYPARLRAKDGSTKHVVINSNVRWVDGRFVHTRCFTRDVTRQVHAERELAQAKQELERKVARRTAQLRRANERLTELVEVKDRFVAMVSHELRTPLTSIRGFAITLQRFWDSLPDGEKRGFVEIIDQQSDRLTRLVNDLLTLSRISSGTLQPRIRPVPVGPIIAETVRELGVEGVTIRARAGVAALADPDYLHQILVNYLANAIRYGRPPIVVKASRAADTVEIRVADRGRGVPADFVDQLFEEFAHGSSGASAGQNGGTGLGLSIVRRLAEAQGGEAWYEPNGRAGAVFAVRLPAAAAP